ncbi:amidohydrolase family protein [Hyalangium sp.]|uniref:amidohydrolase family protein n=1 Tax=Hyalangium sp. TaxID=2028555 RepID=UPI002D22AD9C|nr:amidohydrolase family protein [Hyalangium sp.]HYH95733.1 amidohydrolase family protein [Hyalangium sp.]
MREGFRIIDADRHVVEPLDLWSTHLEPEFRKYAPRPGVPTEEPLTERIARLGAKGLLPVPPMPTLDGRPLWNGMTEQAWLEFSAKAYQRLGRIGRYDDPATYLADMDRTGVDISFLYPGYAMLIEGFADLEPAVASACARVYNTWLKGFCARAPERLRGIGMISLHDPSQMLPELERVAGFGWKAVVVRPNLIGGRALSDPIYEPFWAACEQRSIAVTLHNFTESYVPSVGSDRFKTHFGLHACAHPMEQMMAILSLIEGGVLERYPRLRFAGLESGCGWLPYWLWRLDEVEYGFVKSEVAEHVRMKPSAYFRRQYFVAIEADEPLLPEVIRHLGEDNLLFGSDFPHPDHGLDSVDEILALKGKLPEQTLRKILWDNPARLFGLEE